MQRRKDSNSQNSAQVENTSQQSDWIKSQQNELNSMREKYMSMSGNEMEGLRPVDILNITFEHNKRKAMIINRVANKEEPMHTKQSSSSSSCKNEASFNIFEEIYFDNQTK